MKYSIALLILLCLSCETKKAVNEVDPNNVRAVLSEYGKKNPENEVIIETEFGNMRIRLYDETPLHRANFVKNIKEGVYDDGEFYRVVYQFMVQGGIYPRELKYTIPAEFNKNYIHKKGALSMARSDENNPEMESSSTEFFIVQGAKYADYQVQEELAKFGQTLTPEQQQVYQTIGGDMSLDQKYTTFGEVVEGLEVIDRIAEVKIFNLDKPLRKIPTKISLVSR